MSVVAQFEKAGTLQRPGPIGRVVRLGMGLWITYFFYQLLEIGFFDSQKSARFLSWDAPTHASFWSAVLIFFWVFPYVVNIGFSRNWRRKPQWILLAAVTIVAFAGYFQGGSPWSPVMGWLLLIWLLYVTGHLGFAFLLSAILGTPGCEMRAFHHLWTILTGKGTKEHYCPGFLDKIDRWELNRKNQQKEASI